MAFAKNNTENGFFKKNNKSPNNKLIPNNTSTNCKILSAMSDSGFIE